MLQKCCSYQKSNKIKLCRGSMTAETLNYSLTSVLPLSFPRQFSKPVVLILKAPLKTTWKTQSWIYRLNSLLLPVLHHYNSCDCTGVGYELQKHAGQTYPARFSIFVLFLLIICYITLGEMGDSLLYVWMGKRLTVL